MLDFLKEQINKNKEIRDILKDCDDAFLLENSSMILAALDEDNVSNGYRVSIKIVEGILEWDYLPNSENAKIIESIHNVRKQYSYKLPSDWEKFYLIDLNNDVNWTENKREFAAHAKRILDAIKSKKDTKGIWLYGINNSGKTYASIALLNMISKQNKKVAFVSISELVSKTQYLYLNGFYNWKF